MKAVLILMFSTEALAVGTLAFITPGCYTVDIQAGPNYVDQLSMAPGSVYSLPVPNTTSAIAGYFSSPPFSTVNDRFNFYVVNSSESQRAQSSGYSGCFGNNQSLCSDRIYCGRLEPQTLTSDITALVIVCRNAAANCSLVSNWHFSSPQLDCAPGCPAWKLGNLQCDPQCYTSACEFDKRDCLRPCDRWDLCPISKYNDGTCDPGCYNERCNYDGNDCGASAAGTSTTSNNNGGSQPLAPSSPIPNAAARRGTALFH